MNSVFYPDFYAREAKKVFGQHKGALKCGTRLYNLSLSWGHSIALKIDFIKFMVVCHIHQIEILDNQNKLEALGAITIK